MTLIESISASTGEVTKYAWPGGYPVYYVTSDGASLCASCVDKEIKTILESTLESSRDGWAVEGADINWEDSNLFCDHCSKRIESAYAEDEVSS
jgi:hypothetical protein